MIFTSFEVFEHLKENEIDNLFQNIKIHTHKNSRLILSISTNDSFYKGVNLHQTVKSKNWWLSKFSTLGWEECKLSMKFFNGQYLRGIVSMQKIHLKLFLKRLSAKIKKFQK